MRASAHCALWTIGALMLAALPAFAQEPTQTDNNALAPESPLTPEESTLLANALVFRSGGARNATEEAPALARDIRQRLRYHPHREAGRLLHRRCEAAAANGMEQLGRRRSRPVERDRRQPPLIIHCQPRATAPGSGAAWASLGVPNIGSVDARVDPSNEQGKVGTTLKQSIPFGGRFAVTAARHVFGHRNARPAICWSQRCAVDGTAFRFGAADAAGVRQ